MRKMTLALIAVLLIGGLVSTLAQESAADDIRPAAGSSAPGANAEFVAMKAYLNVDKLPAGETCKVAVLLKVRDGWHINANPAKPENFVPTELTIKSKTGVELKTVKYPKGEAFALAGFDEPLSVYEGQIKLIGTLEIPSDAAGATDEMEIIVRFQPCNNQSCLRPQNVSVKGKLVVAAFGDPVKSINEKLFDEKESPEEAAAQP